MSTRNREIAPLYGECTDKYFAETTKSLRSTGIALEKVHPKSRIRSSLGGIELKMSTRNRQTTVLQGGLHGKLISETTKSVWVTGLAGQPAGRNERKVGSKKRGRTRNEGLVYTE